MTSATLTSLRIRNLALVEELEWQLAPGFTVVTGETGSGKSIIVGALKLVLGERADKTLVRTGADNCSVESIFELRDPAAINTALEANGIDPCEDGQLLLKRVLTASGTNRQFINGSPTTLAFLREIGDGLVDLHGPHDHQSLLSNEKQLLLLDSFAGAEKLRHDYSTAYRKLAALTAEHAGLATSEAALERELDLLNHQVQEIDAAHLQPGEEDPLLARYQVASNSRRLLEISGQLLSRLNEADDAVLGRLNEMGRLLRDFERLDPAAARFTESHAQAVAALEDLARDLQHYTDDLDLEPAQLAELEERVGLFETLKRKYGGSIEEVIAFGKDAAARLHKINSRGEELARLEKEIATATTALRKAGEKLSEKRLKAAPKLAAGVTTHLRNLGFKKSEFALALAPLPQPGPHGMEAAEFLFAPNPGEPQKPLRSIASSGEISRVMLAVKSTLAAQDTVALLVFDEIDANVGGEIAHAVGAKMKELGRDRQVLCISHLPQVAAQASDHFVVTKEFNRQRTHSLLTRV